MVVVCFYLYVCVYDLPGKSEAQIEIIHILFHIHIHIHYSVQYITIIALALAYISNKMLDVIE